MEITWSAREVTPPSPSLHEVEGVAGRLLGTGVEAVAPLAVGDWSRAYALRHRGQDLVIRFGLEMTDFAKDERAAALAGPDLPVPAVVARREVDGVPVCVTERVGGVVLETLDRSGWRSVMPSLLAVLDALRAVPTFGSGFGPWDESGHAPRRDVQRWYLGVAEGPPGSVHHCGRDAIAASSVGAGALDRGLAVIGDLVEAVPSGRHLVHGDLVNANVHVDPGTGAISGVFDWGCALWGDHLYDLAWLDTWSSWHPPMDEVALVATVLDHLARTGVDLTDAAARLRLARVHILLDSLSYCATRGRDQDLVDVHARLLPLLDD